MPELIKLNSTNLPLLPGAVTYPTYDWLKIKARIVHIGIGGFHRAHQALYVDNLLCQKKGSDWGICGIALLENDRKIFDTLVKQNGLYTLIINETDGRNTVRVIGSIIEYLFAPDNPEAVIEKIASPDIKLITLTITEGGYNINSASGEFQMEEPSIQRDLKHPEDPKTIFGYLTQALKRRRSRGIKGLTIQSCDNIQKNGDVLKKMLFSYIKKAEPEMVPWVEKQVAFPNSMVDRITPVTTSEDIEKLKSIYGIDDGWPVVCEPFIQWVIEDNYSNGRPDWESVGALLVRDVGPYEKMKIRLLNAGHSLLGLLGTLYGCKTIDETVRIPMFATLLRNFMDSEVTPILDKLDNIDLENYKDSLIRRFGNPNIKDQVSRICMESSAKIPKFVLPTIREQLERDGPIKIGTLIVAAWCHYLELAGTKGYNYDIQDRMSNLLKFKARSSISADPLAFLKIEELFGDLINSKRFVKTYLSIIESLRKFGIEKTIRVLENFVL